MCSQTSGRWVRTKPKKVGDKVDSMSQIELAEMDAEPMPKPSPATLKATWWRLRSLTNTVGEEGTAPVGFGPLASDLKQKFDELLIPMTGRIVSRRPC